MINWKETAGEEIDLKELSNSDFYSYINYLQDKEAKPDEALYLPLPSYLLKLEILSNIIYLLDKKIPCKKCGHCCEVSRDINLSDSELISICNFLNLTESEVIIKYGITEYTKPNTPYLSFKIKGSPCPFMTGNTCSIYPARPSICETFPITKKYDKTEFVVLHGCKRGHNIKNYYTSTLISLRVLWTNPELEEKLDKLPETEKAKKIVWMSYMRFKRLFGEVKSTE